MIPKGTNVIVPTYALHRNPDMFGDNVDKFDPERFMNDASKDLVDNHIFHSFGGGPRICIGMRFAMEEMKIVLAKLLSNFEIIEELNVTKLKFDAGNIGMLAYKEMKVKIQERKV